MLRMRGAGSDLGVQPGCVEAFFGDRRVVVEMNEIMHHPRMLRLALGDWIQNGCPLELIGVRLIGWQG